MDCHPLLAEVQSLRSLRAVLGWAFAVRLSVVPSVVTESQFPTAS